MKFPNLLLGPFCCLMLVIHSLSRKEDQNSLRGILDGHSVGHASFIESRHYYLRLTNNLRRHAVYDSMECALNCLIILGCRSFNFRLQAEMNGKHFYELLATDKFKNSKRFEPNTEYHHYSILVRVPILITYLCF